jgi:anti-anti-sigma factor
MIDEVQLKPISSQSDIMLIKIRGFFDSVAAYQFQEKVHTLIDDGIVKYIVDLEELEHVSSAGIGFFYNLTMELRKHHGKIIFTNVPEQVGYLFNITRLIEIFPLRESVSAAVAAIEADD